VKKDKQVIGRGCMKNISNGSVSIIIETPKGFPLVRDADYVNPLWKLPGGKVEARERHAEAAERELQEEVGLSIPINDYNRIHSISLSRHIKTFYYVATISLKGLRDMGDEGEEVRIFTLKEIREMKDLLPQHKEVLELLKII